MCSYVANFERGLAQAWDHFLDGNERDHIYVQEKDDGGNIIIGTTETELIAREKRRLDGRIDIDTNEEL